MSQPVFFDIETADADLLHTYGPGFCRLAGYAIGDGPVVLTTDMDELVAVIEAAPLVYGHNALAFDLAALERYHGLDLGRLVNQGRARDTLLLARHSDPPLPRNMDGKRYGLDAIGKRLGVGEKLANGEGTSVLKALAKAFGGYDKIPVDHPDYRKYLVQDVLLTREVAKYLPCDHYMIREHKALWRLNHISKIGWLVDQDALEVVIATQQKRVDDLVLDMHEKYGLPLSTALCERLGRPLPEKVIKAPHATAKGKAAIEAAFVNLGVEPPRTKNGGLATNKDALAELREAHPDNEPLHDLLDAIGALVGERTVAATLKKALSPQGRVHAQIAATQATGRFSVTQPGLTVMGKRIRKNLLERALLLPDPGHRLLCVDLSQIDARAMAAHSQDPAYIKAFAPGKDLHTEMAVSLFGDPKRRSDAKPVTHATSYGMGPKGLAEYAGIDPYEAQQLLTKLDQRFPGLAAFKTQARANAKACGFVYNAFGRPIRIQPGRDYTTGPASYGQGTARDLLVEGILRLPEDLLPSLRGVIHDELVFSIPEEQVEEAKEQILSALQFVFTIPGGEISVPVLAEASLPGRDWADCYRDEYAKWPEVAWEHRQQETCEDPDCQWHNPPA